MLGSSEALCSFFENDLNPSVNRCNTLRGKEFWREKGGFESDKGDVTKKTARTRNVTRVLLETINSL